jgi:BASS family bile acid:Na+ symporter
MVTLAVVGVILLMVFPKLLSFFKANLGGLAAMVLMTAIALGIGSLLGQGGTPEERTTTALVTSMRNPGLALLIAITHGKEVPGVRLAIVTYLLVTILASIPFLRWSRVQGTS